MALLMVVLPLLATLPVSLPAFCSEALYRRHSLFSGQGLICFKVFPGPDSDWMPVMVSVLKAITPATLTVIGMFHDPLMISVGNNAGPPLKICHRGFLAHSLFLLGALMIDLHYHVFP